MDRCAAEGEADCAWGGGEGEGEGTVREERACGEALAGAEGGAEEELGGERGFGFAGHFGNWAWGWGGEPRG